MSDRDALAGLVSDTMVFEFFGATAANTHLANKVGAKVADAIIAAGWRNAVTEREIEHAQDEILAHCYDREDEATQGRAADAARAVARALGLVVEGDTDGDR